jgi:hypothetical protein
LLLLEDWKMAFLKDRNEHFAATLMGPSKALDRLPHDLTVHNLGAYGVPENVCGPVSNYLFNSKQKVKIGESILGPLIFNIFMNDIFYFIEFLTHLFYIK